jgi:hypothetical protein
VTIRPADELDMDQLVAMSQKFHESTTYKDAFLFNEEHVRKTLGWIFVNGLVFVAQQNGPTSVPGALVGMIGVVIVPHLVSGLPTASEVFWWVEPDARGVGLRLLRAAEGWAKENGAMVMQLVAPSSRAEQLYTRLDYRRLESLFQRRL